MCSKNSGSSSSRIYPAGMEDDVKFFVFFLFFQIFIFVFCFKDDYDDRWDIVSTFEDNVKKTSSNMKIRIVPDPLLDAGLNGQRFDKDLEPQILDWYKKFKNIWDICEKRSLFNHFFVLTSIFSIPDKKSPAVSVSLQNFYNSNVNPFLYGLKLFANSPDFNSVKNYSLPFTSKFFFLFSNLKIVFTKISFQLSKSLTSTKSQKVQT